MSSTTRYINLLALAERRKCWPDVEVFVCVKLGTLISAALVVNGSPIRGASGLAGVRGATMRVIDRVLEPAAVDRMILTQSWSRAW